MTEEEREKASKCLNCNQSMVEKGIVRTGDSYTTYLHQCQKCKEVYIIYD